MTPCPKHIFGLAVKKFTINQPRTLDHFTLDEAAPHNAAKNKEMHMHGQREVSADLDSLGTQKPGLE